MQCPSGTVPPPSARGPLLLLAGRARRGVWLLSIGLAALLASLALAGLLLAPRSRVARGPALPDARPLIVQVIALDWKFLFIYPDQGIAAIDKPTFPAGRPISFELTSDRTTQSFSIPGLGRQRQATAGTVSRLDLPPSAPGEFLGENTQFNGEGFEAEKFTARIVAPDAFAAWAARVRGAGRPLDEFAWKLIEADNTPDQLAGKLGLPPAGPEGLAFSSLLPDLFGRVLSRFGAETRPAGEGE